MSVFEHMCFPNLGGSDMTCWVPGLTESYRDNIHAAARTRKRSIYWGSRHNDYYWCSQAILKHRPAAKSILDIGSGSSFWPLYLSYVTSGTIYAVDKVGKDVYGKKYAEFLETNPNTDQIKYFGNGIEDMCIELQCDVITSISAIEHFTPNAFAASKKIIQNTLKAGGLVTLSTDVGTCPGAIDVTTVVDLLMLRPEDHEILRTEVAGVIPGELPNILLITVAL